jgi:hypothetical protein
MRIRKVFQARGGDRRKVRAKVKVLDANGNYLAAPKDWTQK